MNADLQVLPAAGIAHDPKMDLLRGELLNFLPDWLDEPLDHLAEASRTVDVRGEDRIGEHETAQATATAPGPGEESFLAGNGTAGPAGSVNSTRRCSASFWK